MDPRSTTLDPSATTSPPVEGSVNPWVEQWQAGIDPEVSFQHIFQQYYGLVFSYFTRKGFSVEESQDLAQDTFLKVYKSLGTFRRESRFETWLFQITANVYRNTLRAQSTRKRDAAEVSIDEMFEPAGSIGETASGLDAVAGQLDELLTAERSQVLHDALQDLPSQMRRCVLLRVGQDLKYREIADLMRVSIETVKAHLFQARQHLKGKLADYFADPNF